MDAKTQMKKMHDKKSCDESKVNVKCLCMKQVEKAFYEWDADHESKNSETKNEWISLLNKNKHHWKHWHGSSHCHAQNLSCKSL